MSTSDCEVQVSNMILHGYGSTDISQHRESFQQLHRKSRGKLRLNAAPHIAALGDALWLADDDV
jgi:hypothetical protein